MADLADSLASSPIIPSLCPTQSRCQDNCRKILGKPVLKQTVPPAEDDFKTVWNESKHVRSGHYSQNVDNVGFRRKRRRMEYCLAEAVRHFDREFLKGATSMTLSQDRPPESDQMVCFASVFEFVLMVWIRISSKHELNSLCCIRAGVCPHDLDPHFLKTWTQ